MKKRSVPTIADPELQHIVREIYNVLNEIIDAMPESSPQTEADGPEGKIRIVFDKSSARLEVRHKDNWFVSTDGTFTLKEKN